MILKLAEAEWIQPTFRSGSPVLAMYHPTQTLEHLIATCSVLQRTLLGFPPPESRYWTSETVGAVAACFPGLDAAPYAAGMEARLRAEQNPAEVSEEATAREEVVELRRCVSHLIFKS